MYNKPTVRIKGAALNAPLPWSPKAMGRTGRKREVPETINASVGHHYLIEEANAPFCPS
jgi:hypothetical protein